MGRVISGSGPKSLVAVSGSTIATSAQGRDGSRVVNVFTHTSRGWRKEATLKPLGGKAALGFGDSVAGSGTTVVVGAQSEDQRAGRAYLFKA